MTAPTIRPRDPDWDRAVAFLETRLEGIGPVERRLVPYETTGQQPHPAGPAIRTVAVSVLAPGADLLVFFDGHGGHLGWRDDGRVGATVKTPPAPDTWARVRDELAIPDAELAGLRPVFLDPLGWTVELRCRFREGSTRTTCRVWVNPENHRIIQMLRTRPRPPSANAPARGPAGGGNQPRIEPEAASIAQMLLQERLRRAGLRPVPAHRFFVLQHRANEPYDGGVQVRVATWRQWSEALVEYDNANGDPVGWRIDRLADPPLATAADRITVARLAGLLVTPPDGATRPVASPIERGGPVRAWRVTWEHDVGGIVVHGDRHQVDLQPESRRVVGVSSRWHVPAINRTDPVITAADALREATAVLAARGYDDSLVAGRPTLCFIRPTEPPDPADRLAWRVPFADGAGTVDCFVDAETAGLVALTSAR